ncbi:MAG: TlpA disulfide reductase family protein [Longimonas sp.]|uniref:TlpA family protein disulfide reductase n=1 Tax=Longimonas sp. TaxID=2039626 RepID=UPI0039768EB8
MPVSAESDTPSVWMRIAQAIRTYWHWPVLVGVALYMMFQFWPPMIDLDPPGTEAPTFTHETIDGDTFRTADHDGQVMVINVWATWCPPCRIELPGFVDLQNEWKDDVQFVGLATDQQGARVVKPFAEEQGLNYPQIASDTLAYRHFPGEAVPRTYVIDTNGDIRYEHVGFMPKSTLNRVLRALT